MNRVRAVPLRWVAVAVLLLVALVVPPLAGVYENVNPDVSSRFEIFLGTSAVILALYATSYNLMLGYTGMVSFAHAAYYGVGAYTVAILFKRYNVPVLEGLVLAPIVAAVVGLVGTPKWANGGRGSNYAPSSSATFGQFATAAAHRYPWVKQWLVWNEPNQRRWLIPTSPATYTRTLLNPAYAAIHAAIPGAEVGGGVTAPRAATGGVSPVAWIRGMHAAHARLDAYAQNPYPLDPRRETPLRGGCASCPTITMATIGHLVSEVSRNFGSARIWLTEYGYQTNPPDRILGVSYALQARYLGEASARAYRTPRVDMLIHFLVRDEPDLARFQSGLETLSGTPKPAFAAFQLPLAELSRTGTRTRLWGQVRTRGAASYRLERLVGTAWRPLTPNRPAARIFTFTGTLPPGTQVRVVAGSVKSPPLVVS